MVNMKKVYIKFLMALSLLVVVSGCQKEWLELELTGSVPFASQSIDTDEKAFEVLCGAYDFLQVKLFSWSSYYML